MDWHQPSIIVFGAASSPIISTKMSNFYHQDFSKNYDTSECCHELPNMQGEPSKTFRDPRNSTTWQNLAIYIKNKGLVPKNDPKLHRHLQPTPHPHNIVGASAGTFPGFELGWGNTTIHPNLNILQYWLKIWDLAHKNHHSPCDNIRTPTHTHNTLEDEILDLSGLVWVLVFE